MNTQTTNSYDFFVSGRWRNKEHIVALINAIGNKGYRVYNFFEYDDPNSKDKDPETFMKEFEKKDFRNDLFIKHIFQKDLKAQKQSSTFILLLPAGTSSHIEAGIAYGLGKKCILIGKPEAAESLYCMFDSVYETPEEFLKTI